MIMRVLLCAALALLVSCGGNTGIKLTVTFAPTLALDQLVIDADVAGTVVLQPTSRPQTPTALDPKGESIVVQFSDDRAGESMHLHVVGMRGGEEVAEGETTVLLEKGTTVAANIALGAAGAQLGPEDEQLGGPAGEARADGVVQVAARPDLARAGVGCHPQALPHR